MPSLVNGRPVSGYDYDRAPNRLNGLPPEDEMRRDEDDRYRRRNGGPVEYSRFNTDHLDQNSLSDFRGNEPKFELDHLATFAAGTRNGCIHAEDGLRKLRQMENTTGIWTMRCVLIVERNFLVILDNSTGEELERFPILQVQDPTAIFKNDRREIYNNLILFTIVDDPKKRNPQADMHIFQSCKAPAQEIVDEILAAKEGNQRIYPAGGGGSSMMIYQNSSHLKNYRSAIPPPPTGPAPEPPNGTYDFQGMKDYFNSRQFTTTTETRGYNNTDTRNFNSIEDSRYNNGQMGGYNSTAVTGAPFGQQRSFITRVNTIREKEDIEGGSNEILERDVQLLNHCFDDIEKFVARLQQAAEAYKELEKRKKERGAKNKKRQSGDGMLNARARPPPDRDFVDIFQKFKLSFNLLAKLKAHIHDPNAPELVHFLFTPLSLIYEASRDPYHGNQNLGDQAVAPVLTAEAKQLLLNCLTSKEIELWQTLGKHWTTSRAEWNGHIPPYVPEFYDGWQPAASVIDEMTTRSVMSQPPMVAALPIQEPMSARSQTQPSIYNQRPQPFPDDDRPPMSYRNNDFDRFDELPRGGFDSTPAFGQYDPSPRVARNYEPRGFDGQVPRGFDHPPRDMSPPRSTMHSPYSDFIEPQPSHLDRRPEPPRVLEPPVPMPVSRQDENAEYFEELKRMDAIIYEAAHDRQGKNAKELTVQKGDVVHVLENTKNWWKLRNYKGEVGFAPYTILKPLKTESFLNPRYSQLQQKFSRYENNYDPRFRDTPIPNGGPASTRQTASASENSYYEDNLSRRGANKRDPQVDKAVAFQRHHRRMESNGSGGGILGGGINADDMNRDETDGRHHQAGGIRSRQRAPTPPPTYHETSNQFHGHGNNPSYPPDTIDGGRWHGGGRELRRGSRDHQDELHAKVTTRQQQMGRHHMEPFRLTKFSTPGEVRAWLSSKGFSGRALDTFKDYTGWDMFEMELVDFKHLLGHEEAIRLDGLVSLQKNTSGYVNRPAKELNDILEKRKDAIYSHQGSYSPSRESLRDQLVRQRSQLRNSNSQDQF